MIREDFEYYEEMPPITKEQIEVENERIARNMAVERQFIQRKINSKNDDYVVVVPNQDGIFMKKVDAKTKAETEKLVKHFIDHASFIDGVGNDPDNLERGIKREISEATKDRLFTIATIFTADEKIHIIY